jgi:hypothetical protein
MVQTAGDTGCGAVDLPPFSQPFIIGVSQLCPSIRNCLRSLQQCLKKVAMIVPIEKFNKVHGTAMLPVSPDPATDNNKRSQSYAAASSIDREVGRVLDELQSKGTLAATLVVYTGDHGVNCGQHGIWEKGNATVPQNFLEESIRIPCAVSWPNGGIPQNLECELPVKSYSVPCPPAWRC